MVERLPSDEDDDYDNCNEDENDDYDDNDDDDDDENSGGVTLSSSLVRAPIKEKVARAHLLLSSHTIVTYISSG